MGSESQKVRIFVTGFGPFCGVSDNPTSHLLKLLEPALEHGLGIPNIELAGTELLEVSAIASTEATGRLHGIMREDAGRTGAVPFVLHLGVASKSKAFALELIGANDASFRAPDERGACPNNEAICSGSCGLCSVKPKPPPGPTLQAGGGPSAPHLMSNLPLHQLCGELSARGHPCQVSTDAGRFVCNYTYYRSMHSCLWSGVPCLFVHVPSFETVSESAQLAFLKDLFRLLPELLRAVSLSPPPAPLDGSSCASVIPGFVPVVRLSDLPSRPDDTPADGDPDVKQCGCEAAAS